MNNRVDVGAWGGVAPSSNDGIIGADTTIATSASLAVERSDDVDLDPATAEGSLAYAGLSYRWRRLVLTAEVENAALFSYGFRIGTRF